MSKHSVVLQSFFQDILSFTDFRDFFINGELYPGFISALKTLATNKGEVSCRYTFILARDAERGAGGADCPGPPTRGDTQKVSSFFNCVLNILTLILLYIT